MANSVLRNKRVLIIEDEVLIALELESVVCGEGMSVIGPIMALPEALEAATRTDADVAILDISLRGELIWPAADILLRRAVPMLFLSGYHECMLPDQFSACRQLQKPIDMQELLTELDRLLR